MSLNVGQPYELRHGPSKYDLMLGLFDGDANTQRTLTFRVNNGVDVEVKVQSVSREDGSGESWLFEGYVINGTGLRAKGYFHTVTRRGTITIR